MFPWETVLTNRKMMNDAKASRYAAIILVTKLHCCIVGINNEYSDHLFYILLMFSIRQSSNFSSLIQIKQRQSVYKVPTLRNSYRSHFVNRLSFFDIPSGIRNPKTTYNKYSIKYNYNIFNIESFLNNRIISQNFHVFVLYILNKIFFAVFYYKYKFSLC